MARQYSTNRLRKSRLEAGLCAVCGKEPLRTTEMCTGCRDIANETCRRNHADKRLKALSVYGTVCHCCGENNPSLLTFDHVNNDGYSDRGTRKDNNSVIYALARGEYREDIQVECYNCNMGRASNGGVCPHKVSFYTDDTQELEW